MWYAPSVGDVASTPLDIHPPKPNVAFVMARDTFSSERPMLPAPPAGGGKRPQDAVDLPILCRQRGGSRSREEMRDTSGLLLIY